MILRGKPDKKSEGWCGILYYFKEVSLWMMTLSASSSNPLWLHWRHVGRRLEERCRTGRNERLLRGSRTDEKQAASNIFILPVKATRALRHEAQGAHLAKRAAPSWADQNWMSQLKWGKFTFIQYALAELGSVHNIIYVATTLWFCVFSYLYIKQGAEIIAAGNSALFFCFFLVAKEWEDSLCKFKAKPWEWF